MRDPNKKDFIEMEPVRSVLERARGKEIIALYRSIIDSFDQDPGGWIWLNDERNKDHDFVRFLRELKDLVEHEGWEQ